MQRVDTRNDLWRPLRALSRWIASDHADLPAPARPDAVDWMRIVPFILMNQKYSMSPLKSMTPN